MSTSDVQPDIGANVETQSSRQRLETISDAFCRATLCEKGFTLWEKSEPQGSVDEMGSVIDSETWEDKVRYEAGPPISEILHQMLSRMEVFLKKEIGPNGVVAGVRTSIRKDGARVTVQVHVYVPQMNYHHTIEHMRREP